jgi:Tfp pilus assembly protein PilF
MLRCQTGDSDCGLKLLAKAVERSKNDYSHHAWGNGAYYMETWGAAALHAGRADVAEEGFLEALAHDPGSVRAALGMQVLCERQGRATESDQYAALARRSWRRAEVQSLDVELASMRKLDQSQSAQRAQEDHQENGVERATNPGTRR